MLIETIINLNNQSVELIHQHDYTNAIESSGQGLVCSQVYNRDRRMYDSNTITQEYSCQQTTQEGVSTKQHIDRYMSLPSGSHGDVAISSSDSLIYRHGICLPPAEVTDIFVVSSSLIFNAALAHHLLAGQSSNNPAAARALLQKAKQLYAMAHRAVDRRGSKLFRFAVINNLGVIERKLGNAVLSNQYFDYLACTLAQHIKI